MIEAILPGWDVREVHAIRVPAPPGPAFQAVKEVTAREVRALRPLMALRLLPRFLGQESPPPIAADLPVIETFRNNGFALLDEVPGERIVFGAIGQFWRVVHNHPVPGIDSLQAFEAFDAPGYVKAAIGFELQPEGNHTRIVTETRVAGTSRRASRRFRFYWFVIRPGSVLIRWSWLAAIKRRLI